MRDKNIYIKTAGENIFIGGQNRWCGSTRQGAKVQVIPRTSETEREARSYAKRGLCVLLPGRPSEVTRENYDSRKPARGFRQHREKGACLGYEADGSPCTFSPEKGKVYCFRHEYQFKSQ